MPVPEKAAEAKFGTLQEILRECGKLAVSFSGGVDSAFLLKAASDTLGPGSVLAVTVRAPTFPEREFRDAEAIAGATGARHLVLDLDPFSIPGFAENSPERCYHCKKAILIAVRQAAGRKEFETLADGANADDQGDYRPGLKAARELGVRSPLAESGLTKDEIRLLSRRVGLQGWDRPSFACLASRFPYGDAITADALDQVGRAEQLLLDLGFRNVRVRRHGELARIEVAPGERALFFSEDMMDRVDAGMRKLGFLYAALDLAGYRSGSMNAALRPDAPGGVSS